MIKIEAAEFARPVGGRWTLSGLNSESRGMMFEGERDDAGTMLVVWDKNHPNRRVTVPMTNVLWFTDAAEAKAEKGGKR